MEILIGFIFAIFSYIFLFNVILFIGLVYFAYRGIRYFYESRPLIAFLFVLVPALPFVLMFGYTLKLANESESRIAAIASLPRATISGDRDIRSVVVVRNYLEGQQLQYRLGTLISTGALEFVAVAVPTPRGVRQVFGAEASDRCVAANQRWATRFDLRSAAIARNAFRICPTFRQDVRQFEAPIWLYFDNLTPSGNRQCPYASGDAVELRMAEEHGGLLVDFQEIRQARELAMYLVQPSLETPVWIRCSRGPYDPDAAQRVDPFNVVTRALGLESVDDFPRLASEADALGALRILNESESIDRDVQITLLLGQWPSNPEISNYIRSHMREGWVVRRVLTTIHDRNVNWELVRHLRSHRLDLLAVCKLEITPAQCDHWKSMEPAGR